MSFFYFNGISRILRRFVDFSHSIHADGEITLLHIRLMLLISCTDKFLLETGARQCILDKMFMADSKNDDKTSFY